MATIKKLKLKRASTQKAAMAKKTKRSLVRPRTSEQYFALTERQQDIYGRAAQVPAKMRSGISLTAASRELGIPQKRVLALVGSSLRKTKNGRYVAKANDNLLRALVIPGPQGLREVVVRGSETASGIAAYSDAVQRYLQTGDSSRLKKWKRTKLFDESGKRIKLIADPVKLRELGSAGVLSFESLYRRAA